MKHSPDCLCDKCDPVVTKITKTGISLTREKALKKQSEPINARVVELFLKRNKFMASLNRNDPPRS